MISNSVIPRAAWPSGSDQAPKVISPVSRSRPLSSCVDRTVAPDRAMGLEQATHLHVGGRRHDQHERYFVPKSKEVTLSPPKVDSYVVGHCCGISTSWSNPNAHAAFPDEREWMRVLSSGSALRGGCTRSSRGLKNPHRTCAPVPETYSRAVPTAVNECWSIDGVRRRVAVEISLFHATIF